MPLLTNLGYPVQQGEPFTLVFEGCSDGCTVILQRKDGDNMENYKTLTTDAWDHNFTFTLNGLPAGTYDFKMIDNDDGSVDTSSEFQLQGSSSQTAERTQFIFSSATTEPSEATQFIFSSTTASSEISSSSNSAAPNAGSSSSSQNAIEHTSSDDSSISSTATAASEFSIPPSESSGSSNHGLSSGALAGIVVGVLAIVLFVLVGAFLWWRKRKQNRSNKGSNPLPDVEEPNNQVPELEQPKKEILVSPTPPDMRRSTAPSPAAELAGRVRSAELSNTELDNKKELEAEPVVVTSELHGETRPTHSELHAEPAKYEMDSNQQPEQLPYTLQPQVQNPVQQPPMNATHSPSLSTIAPDTGVSIMPHNFGENTWSSIDDTTSLPNYASNEDTTHSQSTLMDQYTQLEARRQRILELQRIEEEQAELQKQLRNMPGTDR